MQSIVITQVQEADYIESCLKKSVTMILWDIPQSVLLLNDMDWEQVSCIVVAIKDMQMRNDIKDLAMKYISEQKILDFWQMYNAIIPVRRVDRVLMNPCITAYEGLILGISHAEVGLISDLFKVPFANLAVSSQDIYYNLKALKYAVEKYGYKLQNVKYVILDMYRYNFFNFDVSRTSYAMNYYRWSGVFDDAHHFNESECELLEKSILDKRLQGITEHKWNLWEDIFCDVHQMDGYRNFVTWRDIYLRNKIVEDKDVLEFDFNKSIVRERFEHTIQENIGYFKQLLLLIKELWPEAKILALSMPQYELNLKRSETFYAGWKQEFLKIIREMQKIIAFEYVDYTNHDIAKQKHYWYDYGHLNYAGAVRFTQEINELL